MEGASALVAVSQLLDRFFKEVADGMGEVDELG